jgi:hypothetical protein
MNRYPQSHSEFMSGLNRICDIDREIATTCKMVQADHSLNHADLVSALVRVAKEIAWSSPTRLDYADEWEALHGEIGMLHAAVSEAGEACFDADRVTRDPDFNDAMREDEA